LVGTALLAVAIRLWVSAERKKSDGKKPGTAVVVALITLLLGYLVAAHEIAGPPNRPNPPNPSGISKWAGAPPKHGAGRPGHLNLRPRPTKKRSGS
jgi:hypothetical protein